ncbi:hypothetical protein ALC62_11729 [Cyphomyrmex costatus]|uniref:Uncharacterized protein n=1 Tax=Cyphomyrmex costatus TaxID=456900 RepID=A0A195C9D8_9HYME|nr:hypothetical protein ALC62_11729 [Cyphomyrmex costatus]
MRDANERANVCEKRQAPGASHRRLNLTDLWFDDWLPQQKFLVLDGVAFTRIAIERLVFLEIIPAIPPCLLSPMPLFPRITIDDWTKNKRAYCRSLLQSTPRLTLSFQADAFCVHSLLIRLAYYTFNSERAVST